MRLLDVKRAKFTAAPDRLIMPASNYGKQSQVYNGVDLAINGRLTEHVQLTGGLGTGQTVTDTCDIVSNSRKQTRWAPRSVTRSLHSLGRPSSRSMASTPACRGASGSAACIRTCRAFQSTPAIRRPTPRSRRRSEDL